MKHKIFAVALIIINDEYWHELKEISKKDGSEKKVQIAFYKTLINHGNYFPNDFLFCDKSKWGYMNPSKEPKKHNSTILVKHDVITKKILAGNVKIKFTNKEIRKYQKQIKKNKLKDWKKYYEDMVMLKSQESMKHHTSILADLDVENLREEKKLRKMNKRQKKILKMQ